MGCEADSLEDVDYYFARDIEVRNREEEVAKVVMKMKAMSDDKMLDFIIGHGKKLNTLPHFKAYDVARRIKQNHWTPTPKQREALINTTAVALKGFTRVRDEWEEDECEEWED